MSGGGHAANHQQRDNATETKMKQIKLAWIVLFLVFVDPSLAEEQGISQGNDILTDITRAVDDLRPVGADGQPRQQECELISDVAAQELCWEATQGYYAYLETQLEHRIRVFWWQHFFSKIIFVVVMIVVAIGLYFAWRQFSATPEAQKESDSPELSSTVEIGASGIKVQSPVLGVVILTLSLGFLYLYLVHVYPIVEIF